MNAAHWNADWATALRHGGTPAGLRSFNGSDTSTRFAVYRNNVAVSLTQALAETFPVVRELVGHAFFAVLARCHIEAHPPRSPVLVEYGSEMPDWIAGFAPAATLPYLADVARLELARVRATHAADASPLSAAALASRWKPPPPAARLAASRPVLHPTLAVIRSRHAVVSLWAAHQGHGRIEDVQLDDAESALVLRQGDGTPDGPSVVVLPLSAAAALFVCRLHEGATLAEASADAFALDPDFDAGTTLARLISEGALVDWTLPGA
jgi:hypothetical protein